MFGSITLDKCAVFICACAFLIGIYRKVESYFKDKTAREIEKDAEYKKMLEQVSTIDQLNQSLKQLVDKVDKLDSTFGADRADTRRYRILRFDDEIRHGVVHTEEHFNQIIHDIEYYKSYCSAHKEYENEKAVFAIENIESVYKKCREERTFLQ
jgi:uncharacterized coiled-coil protein SlyX